MAERDERHDKPRWRSGYIWCPYFQQWVGCAICILQTREPCPICDYTDFLLKFRIPKEERYAEED